MAEEIQGLICLDSSVLIEHFRKRNKQQTFFFKLSERYVGYGVSVVVQYEIYTGSTIHQLTTWDNLFSDFFIIPYSSALNNTIVKIEWDLKKIRRPIEFKDLVIAASSAYHKIPLATLNKKHFDNIDGLTIITPENYE